MTDRVKPELHYWCIVEFIDFPGPRKASLLTVDGKRLTSVLIPNSSLYIKIVLYEKIRFQLLENIQYKPNTTMQFRYINERKRKAGIAMMEYAMLYK